MSVPVENWNDEVESINPLSQEMSKKLKSIDPRIEAAHLREIILKHILKDRIFEKLTTGEQRVIEFQVQLEYSYDLNSHIQKYVRQLDSQSNDQARKSMVDLACKEYESDIDFLNQHDPLEKCEKHVKAVDAAVAKGGLTSLHLAASEGDLDKVIKLVESLGASISVKDNCGFTPLERAEMMGQIEVVTYLRSISAV